ncbi:MAG: carboxypeptidase regulatory-like domain-containing protein [Bacteroidaceae bacterium]|nr:carboxypeptidase regulatory-like domain-containing protein [Bacteroidaceae bacterium]
MKRTLLHYYILLLSLLIVSCTKEIIDTTGNLTGVISDSRSGAFLSGVSVALAPTGKTYTTGVDGKYEFRGIESQEYSVSVSKSGYQSDKRTAFIQVGQDTNLDFQLTPSTGNLVLSQNSIDFGNDATTLTFDIANNGNAALTWQLSENASWLSCNPTSGSTQAGEKSSIVVNIDREGLGRGNYSQTIAVSSNGGSGIINVSMSVQGLMISISPEELDFGPTTTSMELNITNNGSGNISYTITPSNNWIKLSRSTGTFTKTENITVSVDRTSLSEGDHYGNLILTIGEDKFIIPVRMNIPSKEKPTVALQIVDNVTYSSATFKGAIASIGSAKVSKHGFCWSTSEEPTVSSTGICNLGDSEKAKDFTYNTASLEPSTTYYVRAYAENIEGISYSNQMKFQTTGTPQLATVETGAVSNIQSTQAQITGNIISLGNTDGLSQYGHVWNTKQSPTISNSKNQLGSTESTGTFNSTLTDLSPNTKYYVRSYAVNSVGTSYGNEVSFTTSYADVVLSTGSINNITHNTATCNASITSKGGHTITEKGFCWGASSKPTLSNNSITSSSTSDTFSANISGLSESTTYHIRAYVKTEDGKTFYGNDVAFSTTAKGVKIDKNGYGEDSNWTR